MEKLIIIANRGRVRPVTYKPAGEDPLEQAHLVEVRGNTVKMRPDSVGAVVTDQAGRFGQSNASGRRGGMSYGEEHELEAELDKQAMERVAGKIGEMVEREGYPAWRLIAPPTMMPYLLAILPAAALRVLAGTVTGDWTKLPLAALEKRLLNGHKTA